MNKYKGILAIDFDGTIASTTYPKINGLIQDSKKYINKLYNDGWYIIIWTCRCNDGDPELPLDMMKDFLDKEGILYNKINEHHPALVEFYGNNTRKVLADYYIDDKNLFGLPPWKKIYKYINNVKIKSALEYIFEVKKV